jgi:threonine aldolase
MSTPGSADSNRTVDYRSDTVTRPDPGMRKAMANARVGDDVYGEDPTVATLEARVAAMLDKEAGLFVPSGTMSNLIGVLVHCARGEEFLIGNSYHVYRAEALGTAVLGGVASSPLPTSATGALDVGTMLAAIKPDDPHRPITRLLCLENTVSGHVQPQPLMDELADAAHRRGLTVHLDGARLMNAAVAQERTPAALASRMDSVSLCLSKGLGAPVGSVLSGSEPFIRRARRLRKMLGGGMRQSGVLAAAGLHALEHNVDRLAEDHANARRLAEELAEIPALGVERDPSNTNMLFIEPDPAILSELKRHLEGWNILIGSGTRIRMVTHLDVDAGDVERTVAAFRDFYAASRQSPADRIA